MINNFLIKAIPSSNILKVSLDGIFMKSEVELALLLIKNESKKLREGFRTIIDVSNFQPKGDDVQSIYYKIQQLANANLYLDSKSGCSIEREFGQ